MFDLLNQLVRVRYYTPADAHFFTVDNRPLVDLDTNVNTANGLVEDFAATPFISLVDSSGVANTLLVTCPLTLSAGVMLNVRVANNNTGTVNLISNGQVSGPTTPVLMNGSPLNGGELLGGQWYILLYDGTNLNVLAGTGGVVSADNATQGNQAVTLGQTASGTVNLDVNLLTCTDLTINEPSTVSTSTSGFLDTSSNNSAVPLTNIQQGIAGQASLVDWTSVTSDQVLPVGQTAYYNVTTQENSVPLYISCGENQLYEVIVVQTQMPLGYDGVTRVFLYANYTTYAGQFYYGGFETSTTNQGSFYAPASSTTAYGVNLVDNGANNGASLNAGFFFDQVYGGAGTPYIHSLRIFTGNSNTNPMGLCLNGGGTYNAAGTAPGIGNSLNNSVWNNGSTTYATLGTLTVSGTGSSTTCEWQILVRRLA